MPFGDRIVAAEALASEGGRGTPHERQALEEIRQRLESWRPSTPKTNSRKASECLADRPRERRRSGFSGRSYSGP
jgi:hypothetical protein